MTATASNSDARKRQERQQGEHLTHHDAGVRAIIAAEVAKELRAAAADPSLRLSGHSGVSVRGLRARADLVARKAGAQ